MAYVFALPARTFPLPLSFCSVTSVWKTQHHPIHTLVNYTALILSSYLKQYTIKKRYNNLSLFLSSPLDGELPKDSDTTVLSLFLFFHYIFSNSAMASTSQAFRSTYEMNENFLPLGSLTFLNKYIFLCSFIKVQT